MSRNKVVQYLKITLYLYLRYILFLREKRLKFSSIVKHINNPFLFHLYLSVLQHFLLIRTNKIEKDECGHYTKKCHIPINFRLEMIKINSSAVSQDFVLVNLL